MNLFLPVFVIYLITLLDEVYFKLMTRERISQLLIYALHHDYDVQDLHFSLFVFKINVHNAIVIYLYLHDDNLDD